MSYQAIGLGTNPNDGTGATLRAAGTIINANFTELYTALGSGGTLSTPAAGTVLQGLGGSPATAAFTATPTLGVPGALQGVLSLASAISGAATLTADAANTLALRNGTSQQAFNLYGTYTDATHNELLQIAQITTGALGTVFSIAPVAGSGGGTLRSLNIAGGTANGSMNIYIAGSSSIGIGAIGIATFWQWSSSGHFTAATDNTYDIGASGANRPRNLYVATSLQVGSAGGAAAPSLAVGNATTGLYSVSTTGFALTVNGITKLDYGITNSGGWTVSGNLIVSSTGLFAWNGRSTLQSPADSVLELSNAANTQNFFVCAPNTATLQLGNADTASPVAQTLQVQNVVAGTSNTSGVNWTLNGSLSTGTGTSGDIVIQTGGTGAGATSQNALVTALTVKGATQQVILATNLRINVAPTANTSASTTITNGADSSTNLGHRAFFNLNGTTYWFPCGSVAF